MRKLFPFISILIFVSACYKINPWLDRRAYDGVWTLDKKVITQFDESGNASGQNETNPQGELTLRKDSLLSSSGIDVLPTTGRWTVNRIGKGDVLYIWNEPTNLSATCDYKITVTKKTAKKMVLQFIQIGTTGKIEYKTEYYLSFKEKVNYDDPPYQPATHGFKYTDKTGSTVVILLINIDVENDSYIPSGGGAPVACKKVTLEFSHYNENNVYQAVKVIFNTDDDGDYTGNYPYDLIGGNRVMFMAFWDGGTSSSFYHLIQQGSTSLFLNEIDTESNLKIVKGSWAEIKFSNTPQSLNEPKMLNVEIDARL